MRRFIKKFKNSIAGKILKAILKLLWWFVEVVIIFLAIVIVTQRVTANEKTFLGFRIFNVATGSMEPEYAVGDILISREREPSQIKVGDNIVYLGDKGGYEGKIITHNVIQIEQNEQGEYLFHTKGRANTVEDPIVHQSQLYGVIVQNNIVLAWLCKILTNRYGLYFVVIVPIILYAFINFVRVQGEKIEAEREQKRLEAEKRKKHKRKPEREVELIEEEPEEEVITEEKVKTPKKAKTKEVSEEVKKVAKTSKEEKSAKTEKNVKTNKSEKSTKTDKTEKQPEKAKKATNKKQAKEE